MAISAQEPQLPRRSRAKLSGVGRGRMVGEPSSGLIAPALFEPGPSPMAWGDLSIVPNSSANAVRARVSAAFARDGPSVAASPTTANSKRAERSGAPPSTPAPGAGCRWRPGRPGIHGRSRYGARAGAR